MNQKIKLLAGAAVIFLLWKQSQAKAAVSNTAAPGQFLNTPANTAALNNSAWSETDGDSIPSRVNNLLLNIGWR